MDLLLAHYGTEQPADTVDDDEYTKKAIISPDIRTEWKTIRSYLSKLPIEAAKRELCTPS